MRRLLALAAGAGRCTGRTTSVAEAVDELRAWGWRVPDGLPGGFRLQHPADGSARG